MANDVDLTQWTWQNCGEKSENECRDFLKSYYCETRNEVPTKADFAEEWESETRQARHLPATFQLLRRRLEAAAHEIRYGREGQAGSDMRTLLLMAGFSSEQLALSIACHYVLGGVDEIVPFVGASSWTEVSEKLPDALERMLGPNLATAALARIGAKQTVEPGSPAKVFRKIVDWYWDKNGGNQLRRCAVDVTGGQKPMDAGGSYAAAFLGFPAYYLDFETYDVSARRPYPHTLRYVELALPGSLFSLDSRKAVVEHFHSRRFHAAFQRLRDIHSHVRTPQYAEFFQSETDDIDKALAVVDECNAWMAANYQHKALQSHVLHGHFTDVMKKGPREALIQTLESPHRIVEYAKDEYWRLRTMLKTTAPDASPSDQSAGSAAWVSEQVRDVLVGSCGLAELIVDAVLFNPAVRIQVGVGEGGKGGRLRFKAGDGSDGRLSAQLRADIEAWFRDLDRLPPRRLPGSVTKQKSLLL